MSQRQHDDIFDTLSETRRLLGDLEIPAGEEFSLDAILAEFGQGAAEPAPTAQEAAEELTEMPCQADDLEENDPAEDGAAEDVPAPEQKEEDTAPVVQKRCEEVPVQEIPAEETPAEEDAPEERRKVLRLPKLSWKKKETTAAEEEPAEELPEEEAVPTVREELPDLEELAEEAAQPLHISLEDVMAHTVDAVMEENSEEEPPVRIALAQRMTGAAESVAAWRRQLSETLRSRAERREAPEPEPEMEQADREERRRCKRLRRQMILAGIPAAMLLAVTVLDTWWPDVLQVLWSRVELLRQGSVLGLLALTVLAAAEVWKTAFTELKKGRFTVEAAAALLSAAVFGDGAYAMFGAPSDHLPLAAPAALLIWLCLAGELCTASALRSACHLADMGGRPPYAVTVSSAGACKQQGRLEGFYNTFHRSDPARRAQMLLLPLLLGAATMLSGVVCIGEGRMEEFFRIWSAMLTLSVPLALPLSGTLPVRNLNHRLCRSACAVAGYAGAKTVSESRRMVVTDGDLFPPGTVSLNGLKLYGEEIGKVVSYAATMTRAARSQLHPIFEQLLSSEGGSYRRAEDLKFYEEGGFSAAIHGETVSMGSAYFMKKHKVELPRELKVKTGVFLAVDGQLVAIFAIKYQASRNVEWALRAMRRSRIEPVLAVRSGNITPGLIKRRFGLDPKAVYPEVAARLALSDLSLEDAPEANAIIYREGLMPFAETVIGSRRCCRAVRRGTVLCWLGGLAGLWLGYYLSHMAAYGALNAGYILAFLLLWLLPSVLLADMARRY